MNKKTLIACLILLAVLVAGIALAVGFLYSGTKSDPSEPVDRSLVEDRNPLLSAVPSDAAILLTFKNMEDGLHLLQDSTKVFGEMVAGTGKRGFNRFVDRISVLREEGRLRTLDRSSMAVSLHYSGDLVPLMLVSAPQDTTADIRSFLAAADSAGMVCRHVPAMLVLSPSETLVRTALRHLDGGVSILDNEGFPEMVSRMEGEDALYFSNVYAGKIFSGWLTSTYARTSAFFSTLAEWTAFSLAGTGEDLLRMKAAAVYGSSSYFFMHVPVQGEARAASVLPGRTVFAVDLPMSDVSAWIDGYRKYLDAGKKLGRYKSGNSNFQKSFGLSAEQWAQQLDIKEVAKAVVQDGDIRHPLLFVRPGKADAEIILRDTGVASLKDAAGVLPFAWKGYLPLLFGGLFNIPDDSYFVWHDGWMVIGDAGATGSYTSWSEESLRSRLAEYGLESRLPERSTSLLAYLSMDAALADEALRPGMASAWKNTLRGLAFEPVVLSLSGDAGSLTVDRVSARQRRAARTRGTEAAVMDVPVDIEVPAGPFTVRNSGTGKDNTFSQSANLALQLRDENGKTLWSLPFKTPLCGYVSDIDYYANGKIQFLFASGSKLYLIDRLGRMVSGFPAELGKEVLLGPGVYDFTGAHGYTAMILHKDNTIGMYDLHGIVREGWLGIAPEKQIVALPELVTVEGKKYWVVRTADEPVVYGFYGGDPAGKNETKKVLKTLKQ